MIYTVILVFLTYYFVFKQSRKIILNYGITKKSFLIFAVMTIPYGKMIYVPIISHLPNLKFSFLISILSVLFFFRKDLSKYPIVLILVSYLLISSFYYGQYLDYPMSTDFTHLFSFNTVFRSGVIFFFILFTFLIIDSFNEKEEIVFLLKSFVEATLYTIIVGSLMFIFIFLDKTTQSDLSIFIVAGDMHLIDNIFRFNPGHNVNEFSQIISYALILMLFLKNNSLLKFAYFHLALFLTLTRFSWMAYFLSLTIVRFKYAFLLVAISLSIFFISYPFLDENVKFLIESRFNTDIGASGYERIEKFTIAYNAVTDNIFRLLFGYGFSTNMYVHNVYLQVLNETGLIGLLLFSIFLLIHYFRFINNKYSLALAVFILFEAIAHHILFLGETWFALIAIVLISRLYSQGKLNAK